MIPEKGGGLRQRAATESTAKQVGASVHASGVELGLDALKVAAR
jgi:hypothetical protein